MKKRLLFVLAALSVLTITGCKDSKNKPVTLAAPNEVVVQSNDGKSLIIFSEVPNAEYYEIYINDVCVTVKSKGSGDIYFDASKIITEPQKYTIKVKATSSKHFDSGFTKDVVYNHTTKLDAPVISMDTTTLNWNKIPNAEYYEVVLTSLLVNATTATESKHRTSTNKFDFSNLLTNQGEYIFKVRAISGSEEYTSSILSNQLKYIHKLTLNAPANLKFSYSNNGEILVSFVGDANVKSYTMNINGVNYDCSEESFGTYIQINAELPNVYTFNLTNFAKAKNINVSNSKMMEISIKANSTSTYLNSSAFSPVVSSTSVSKLKTPTFEIKQVGENYRVNIRAINSSVYLAGFAIYLEENIYTTLMGGETSITLPKDVVQNKGIRVQAVSNNNNCYSSNFTEAQYVNFSLSLVNPIEELKIENNLISWGKEDGVKYMLEIIGDTYHFCANMGVENSRALPDNLPFGVYAIKVTAFKDGFMQRSSEISLNFKKKLNAPSGVKLDMVGNIKYITFDAVDFADGYILYVNDVKIKKLFTSTSIALSDYINEIKTYKIQVQAISLVNSNIEDSELSASLNLESKKTISTPELKISLDNEQENYYLNIKLPKAEQSFVKGYSIWVNYQEIAGEYSPTEDAGSDSEYVITKVDISSYLQNAGSYNFMVKAKSYEENIYVNDSSMANIEYKRTKQLDAVTNIEVNKIGDEGRYLLTFKEQTLAAKYLVEIVKIGDESYQESFEVASSGVDISKYVAENGIYRVYVTALATPGSYYIDAATSGNPYRLSKLSTLPNITNIQIVKQGSAINLAWSKITNASGYQLFIYYNRGDKNELKLSMIIPNADVTSLNIGSGSYMCLDKEGSYFVQIKALGDEKQYENSLVATKAYDYAMETSYDFARNTVFIGGGEYDHKITSADQLKNLLWYHYLYNTQLGNYNSLQYNLKVYCDLDLDELAAQVDVNLASEVSSLVGSVNKMSALAEFLLKQYPELADYTLGYEKQAFCLSEQTNVYLFRYQDQLESFKTETIETQNIVYGEKLELIDIKEQRLPNYVFAIDNSEFLDVSTTEQLFMAVQYNRKPNFIGDSAKAKAVYENARFILRQICTDNMSEYEKTLAIFNFLTKAVVLNSEDITALNEVEKKNINLSYLESILYNNQINSNGLFSDISQIVGKSADSNGLAKTFVVLCQIEGINCVKRGQRTVSNGVEYNYAWNEVDLDITNTGVSKQTYTVDLAASFNYVIVDKQTYQIATHKQFLTGNTELDYYSYHTYSCEYNKGVINNAKFVAEKDGDIVNALIYGLLKADNAHRIVIDLEASRYIESKVQGTLTEQTIKKIISNITDVLYNEAKVNNLDSAYTCKLNVEIVDSKYIVLIIDGNI